MKYPNILEENIYSNYFKDKFLVIGSCLPEMYPEVTKKFAKKWENVVSYCLETFHYNQLMAKMFDILALGKTSKVAFLTVDGSPHCLQMHFLSKYLTRGLNKKVEFEHYVVKRDGRVFKVEMSAIDKAKDLSPLGKEVKI